MFLKERKENLRRLIYVFHSPSLNCIQEVFRSRWFSDAEQIAGPNSLL